MTARKHDFSVENHGSIFLVRPSNKVTQRALKARVSRDAMWFGNALCVEPRFIGDLVDGLSDEGFSFADVA